VSSAIHQKDLTDQFKDSKTTIA